jgi:hypothetical protein
MGKRCVHGLLGGTSILLLFPTDYCGGFLFQFFLSRTLYEVRRLWRLP